MEISDTTLEALHEKKENNLMSQYSVHFLHWFNNYLLNFQHVPKTVLGSGHSGLSIRLQRGYILLDTFFYELIFYKLLL